MRTTVEQGTPTYNRYLETKITQYGEGWSWVHSLCFIPRPRGKHISQGSWSNLLAQVITLISLTLIFWQLLIVFSYL